jgi:hypothetical protein
VGTGAVVDSAFDSAMSPRSRIELQHFPTK